MSALTKWLTGSLIVLGTSGILVYNYSGLNGNNEIVAFSINNAEGVIHQVNGEIDVTLPTGTNLTALIPDFTATGPNVTVRGKAQYSGISAQNFESDVPYLVHASNGNTKNYFVHVTEGTPTESISYFQFLDIDSNTNGGLSNGIITGNNIAVTVPYNTSESSLISYFNFVGTTVKVNGTKQISNITTNDFTSPVTYDVHGEDGSDNPYIVTVTKAAATAKAITSFSIITSNGIFPGVINGTNITVGVPESTVVSNLIAQYSSTGSLVKVGSLSQRSGLTVNDFSSPVVYTVTSGDGLTTQNYTVTVNNEYAFLDVHNLADTIFDNTTYPVQFRVTNHESSTISGISATVTVHEPFTFTETSNTCTGNLLVSSTCVLSGNLTESKPYGRSTVEFTLVDGSSQVHASYDHIVTAVPKLIELEPSIESPAIYAAYRFANVGSHRLFATAQVNDRSICFDNNHVGTIESQESQAWSTCAVEMTRNNDTLYIPAYPGVGGKVLLSIDNKIPDGPSPSVTSTDPADTYYTIWQQVEYGGGLNGASESVLFNLNPTNVNFVSFATTVSTVISGVVGPYGNNSYVAQGITYGRNILTQSVLGAMESGLNTVPNIESNTWQNLTQFNAGNTAILRILAPATIFPFMSTPSSQFYFNGTFFNQYIDDLWSYYKDTGGAHYLYVDDSPAADIITPGAHCILRCQVTNADDKMHCAYYSGTCPTNASSGTLDGEYTNVGGFSSESGFTKFTAVDFISAAGTSAVTTFGADGTYRSVTGENIVAGQSVGFLPFCSDTGFVFGTSYFVSNESQYYVPQYGCLTNYSNYTSSVLDQYSAQSIKYFSYYNYGYTDTLGQSGAVYSLSNESYPFTIQVNYQ